MKINVVGLSDTINEIHNPLLKEYSTIKTNTQKEIVEGILNGTETFHVINSGRQGGKTECAIKIMLALCFKSPISFLMVGPDYDLARKVIIKRIIKILQNSKLERIIKKISTNPVPYIEFTNGSEIVFRSAENGEAIRGNTHNHIWFDEFAKIQSYVFDECAFPTVTTADNPKIIFTSTPFGRDNQFYDFYTKGLEGEEDYRSYNMIWTSNPKAKETVILKALRDSPTLVFQQEWLGQFVEGEGSVFKDMKNYCILTDYQKPNGTDYYHFGVDWGSTHDKTVLVILNSIGQMVYYYSTNKNETGTNENMVSRVVERLKQFNVSNRCRGFAEVNSIGDDLCERLIQQFPFAETFYTSANAKGHSKSEIINKLCENLNTGDLFLPTRDLNPTLFTEMESFELTFNQQTRQIKYGARPGRHDDTVMALALANWSRFQNAGRGVMKHSTYIPPNRW